MKIIKSDMLCDRRIDFFSHTSRPQWGYNVEQTDTFAVHYPKDFEDSKEYPLYVVFHSAGHDVYSATECVRTVGNHDIYHTPDDMFGLFLDCRANSDNQNDWWWGGITALGEGSPERSERKQPVENRCIATVEWMMDNYCIDRNRVYAVGNSMGGSGALGVALCRGDLFTAIKVNVPAGVRHAADRCFLDKEAPTDFSMPDPPIVVDYSSQTDEWSTGHEVLYRCMREKRYALYGYWGEYGHQNNHAIIAEYNDLIHSLPVFELVKNEAYPVFTDADTDDENPWEHPDTASKSGQVNSFFRWEVIEDTDKEFRIKLWLLSPDEWETRVTLPVSATADLLLRRVQNFRLEGGEAFKWRIEDDETLCGLSHADGEGHPSISRLTVTVKPRVLILKRK